MLNEDSISLSLDETVMHLELGDHAQARGALDALDLARLTRRPVEDPSKMRRFVDPAGNFGVERVHATCRHVGSCLDAISAGNSEEALREAKAAAARWKKKGG